MLTTPSGSPASAQASARMWESSAVCGAGLSTTVQPAASAGPSFIMVIIWGKFQGTIAATTPTGSSTTSAPPSLRTCSKLAPAARAR